MERSQNQHVCYFYTQLSGATMSRDNRRFWLDLNIPNEILANIHESSAVEHIHDAVMSPESVVSIMWVYYLHPRHFNRTSDICRPLIQIARFIYHHVHRERSGDKPQPLEQFLWMFLAEFDAAPPSPAPHWGSELDGVCVFRVFDELRAQLYPCEVRGELSVYNWPSYHAATIQLLTREFYDMLGHATAPLAPAAHKAVYKKIAKHLQVARLPHVKLLIEAYLEKCVAAGAEDPEYITRRALYRMKITGEFDTRTEIGRAMRQHEFVTEHMWSVGDPPEEAPGPVPVPVPAPAPAPAPGPAPSTPPHLERQRAVIHEPFNNIVRNLLAELTEASIAADSNIPRQPYLRVEIPPLNLSAITHVSDDETPATPPRAYSRGMLRDDRHLRRRF